MKNLSRWKWIVVGLVVLLSPIGKIGAQTSRPRPHRKIDTKTETIRGLKWHASLAGAVAANKKTKGVGKPIFFVRMLGDMLGKT